MRGDDNNSMKLLLAALLAAADASLLLRTPSNDVLAVPAAADAAALKAWALEQKLPRAGRFAASVAAHGCAPRCGAHHGYTFEEGPPPRYFWTGLVLALLVASGPPSIYEMVETKKVTDISVAQVFLGGVVPPVCCLAMLAHAVEAGGALAPGSTWAPSMPAFLFIFGTAAAALHYFAVANEIRLGAALMVLFAYLYYFTSFWLVL